MPSFRDVSKRVHEQLANAGGRFAENTAKLRAEGWTAFEPVQSFRRSFCPPTLGDVHEQVEIEIAREMTGNNAGHTYLDSPPKNGVSSALLNELRARRLRDTGLSFRGRDLSRPWLTEIDPCRKEELRERAHNLEAYRHRLGETLLEVAERRRREAERYDRLGGSPSALADSVSAIASQYGFEREIRLRSRTLLTFSRCRAPNLALLFHLAGGCIGADEGVIDTRLELRAVGPKQELKVGDRYGLTIPYKYAVPISVLYRAPYDSFTTGKELTLNLHVHLYVCRLIGDEIDQAVGE